MQCSAQAYDELRLSIFDVAIESVESFFGLLEVTRVGLQILTLSRTLSARNISFGV